MEQHLFNYKVDNNNIITQRLIRFCINYILMYIFIFWIFYVSEKNINNNQILLCVLFSSIVLYVLDLNFPTYIIKSN